FGDDLLFRHSALTPRLERRADQGGVDVPASGHGINAFDLTAIGIRLEQLLDLFHLPVHMIEIDAIRTIQEYADDAPVLARHELLTEERKERNREQPKRTGDRDHD